MVIYNCYNITRLHQYFYILKNTEKLFQEHFYKKCSCHQLFRIFFVSCSTGNDFMNPVNTGYSLIN